MILYMHIPCFHLLQDDHLLLYGTIRWFFLLLHQVTFSISWCIRSPQKTTTTGPQGEHLFQDVLRNCFGLRVYEHVVVSSGSIMLRGKDKVTAKIKMMKQTS
jgi:hypothetical protein